MLFVSNGAAHVILFSRFERVLVGTENKKAERAQYLAQCTVSTYEKAQSATFELLSTLSQFKLSCMGPIHALEQILNQSLALALLKVPACLPRWQLPGACHTEISNHARP